MWLNTKRLTQFKAFITRYQLPLLVTLVGLILAIVTYSLSRSTSGEIVVMPTPVSKLTPTALAAATTIPPTVEINGAASTDTVAPDMLHLSLAKDSVQAIGSVTEVRDEDILSYDGVDFAMVFDGSAAGLPINADVDAFDFLDAATILMSFDKPVSIDSLKVDDSDIVKFEATTLGQDNTAGTFSLFLDGATVGLKTNRANVDAFTLLPDGSLLISTEARVKVPGVNGDIRAEKEDILAFDPAAPGDYRSGSWSLYFDGANVGIRSGSENIDGLAIGPEGEIYLTTTGKFSVNGIAGGGEDIFIYTPASPDDITTSNFSTTLFFHGKRHGLNRNDVDAIGIP